MNEVKKIEILDLNGKTIRSKNDNKIKNFFKNNVWNVLGTGITTCITAVSLVKILVAWGYASSCSFYYGIDKRYFNSIELFKDKVIIIIAAVLFITYPFLFNYINTKMKSKIYITITFLITIFILFTQNVVYTSDLLDEIEWSWVKKLLDNYITLFLFLITDIIIAYYIILRSFLVSEKKLRLWERIILFISIAIYSVNVSIGISLVMGTKISDKKMYEVINDNQVIIDVYDGKFLTMNCKVQNDELHIEKGRYSFIDMTENEITYHKFKIVICN